MTQSVLAFLALRLGSHPENIATEALGFVLARSSHARRAIRTLAKALDFDMSDEVSYATQVRGDEGGQPDLAGTSESGELQILIEAKFWAGLTSNQPTGYLRRLPGTGALLLFVAPARRMETLWLELVRRAETSAEPGPLNAPRPTLRARTFGAQRLALTSWSDLLSTLLAATDTAGESDVSADIRQLMSLCDRMDTDAFLPLMPEELTAATGRRVVQFGELASDLAQALIDRGVASGKGLRSAGSNGWFGRYLLLKGYGAVVHFDAWGWTRWGESPLWLKLHSPQWKFSPAVGKALRDASIPYRDSDSGTHVPIYLPSGQERDGVVLVAIEQLLRVADALPSTIEPTILPPQGVPTPSAEPIEGRPDAV